MSTRTDHTIEHAVKVYLIYDPTQRRWVIDPVTLDGHELDSPLDDVDGDACPSCDGLDDDTRDPVHESVLDDARSVPLPTGRELYMLLNDALVHASQTREPTS